MLKKRMRKKDTKKGAAPARTPARLSATQIPCLSLPGLGKGGLAELAGLASGNDPPFPGVRAAAAAAAAAAAGGGGGGGGVKKKS